MFKGTVMHKSTCVWWKGFLKYVGTDGGDDIIHKTMSR